MAKNDPPTWTQVGIRNSDFRTTVRALRFAMAWGLATATLGKEPGSVEEFAETMEMNRRTAFRDQGAFRRAFPSEATPGRMNRDSGSQAKYDAAWRKLKDLGKAEAEVEPLTFDVGSAIADV
jgi:hypothetical protein